MSTSELKTIKDFEWGSVVRYIRYIETYLDLSDLGMDRLYSFQYGRFGAKKLTAQKVSLLATIEGNMSALAGFALDEENDIQSPEMVVIKSMYVQLAGARRIAKEHICTVERLEEHRRRAAKQLELGPCEPDLVTEIAEGDDDDALF